MRTHSLLLAGLALLAATSVPAAADTGSTAAGHCWLAAGHGGTGPPNEFAGVLAGAVTLLAADGSAASGLVRCEVRVNGVATQPAAASGAGAVAFGRAVHYADAPDYRVEVCLTVDFEAPDPTPSQEKCQRLLPPAFVWDTLNELDVLWWIGGPLCRHFEGLAGDYGGVVVVNSQGDVFVGGEPRWDCPPYDVDWSGSSFPEAHAAVVLA